MDIHGFHCVSEHDPDPKNEEGFLTTVSHPDKKIPIRGPFKTITEAVQCAHAWNKEDPDAARRVANEEEEAKIAKSQSERDAK